MVEVLICALVLVVLVSAPFVLAADSQRQAWKAERDRYEREQRNINH